MRCLARKQTQNQIVSEAEKDTNKVEQSVTWLVQEAHRGLSNKEPGCRILEEGRTDQAAEEQCKGPEAAVHRELTGGERARKEAGDRVVRTNSHRVPWLHEDLRLGGGCHAGAEWF